MGTFFRGLGLVFRSPRLVLLGALPALLTAVLLLGGLVALAVWADDLVTWATPFADDWNEVTRATVRLAAGVSLVLGATALAVLAFAALALAVGGPFYEAIAERVEDELGGVAEAESLSWWRGWWIGLRDGITLVVVAALVGIVLFAAGFIPVAGQTVVPVLGVCVNAWLLGLELTAIPFARRGLALADRRRALRRRRALTLGFALPAYLLCLVPFAALVVMPGAMAGGTLLAHRVLTAPEPARA
ncbi:CysZ protein [Goodfellowiella coeruleoviolacea]|uniref:CysZ protein n=1 Tax=Goodfellowiella coeruleoviolacea TaxID=334858 RepID=A0AAE3GKS0_9PSEU|nr:CysZ protein [Goodfellowiella coeruleoviolacea]